MAKIIKRFNADQFTPTEFDSAAVKAEFANRLASFIEQDFPPSLFTKNFYRRLSMTFGHIAHYDQNGFWGTFFTTDTDKLAFLHQTFQYRACGSPEYTYCDVERVIQHWITQNLHVVQRLRDRLASDNEKAERTQLAQLKAKYETPA